MPIQYKYTYQGTHCCMNLSVKDLNINSLVYNSSPFIFEIVWYIRLNKNGAWSETHFYNLPRREKSGIHLAQS